MALMRWQPFREMLSLREVMDQLFEQSFIRPSGDRAERPTYGQSVAVDMRETDDELIITAPLPGLTAEDVDINVRNGNMVIKGETRSEEESDSGTWHYRERRYGSFLRTLTLPTTVDADAAEASLEEGILKVTLPKTEEAKPKQIAVKTTE